MPSISAAGFPKTVESDAAASANGSLEKEACGSLFKPSRILSLPRFHIVAGSAKSRYPTTLVARILPRRSRILPRAASSVDVEVLDPIAGINFDGGSVFSWAVRRSVTPSAKIVATTTPREIPRMRDD